MPVILVTLKHIDVSVQLLVKFLGIVQFTPQVCHLLQLLLVDFDQGFVLLEVSNLLFGYVKLVLKAVNGQRMLSFEQLCLLFLL